MSCRFWSLRAVVIIVATAAACAPKRPTTGESGEIRTPTLESTARQPALSATRLPERRRCSVDGWCWDNPSPAGDHLRAVWGFAAGDVFAAGDGGVILHFDGQVWSSMASPTDDPLMSMWGAAPDDVFAGGRDGLLHYDGSTWTRMPDDNWHAALWGFSSGALVSVSPDGALRLSNDGGRSWPIEDPTGGILLTSVWGSAPNRLVAVGDFRTAGAFDDNVWTPLAPPPPTGASSSGFLDVWGTSAGELFVATDEGVAHFNGSTWSSHPSPDRDIVYSIWGWSPSEVVAVGDVMMERRGSKWTSTATPDGVRMQSVWGADPDHVVAVGECGTIVHRDDGVWTQYGSTVSSGLVDVWGLSDDDIYAVGDGVLHYDGSTWVREYDGPRGVAAVWGPSPDEVFAAASGGVALHRTRTGWTEHSTGIQLPLNAIHGSGPHDVFVVANAGKIAHYDGEHWEQQSSGTRAFLNGVYVAAPNDAVAVGDGGVILHYDGSRWTAQPSGTTDSLTQVWGTSGDDIHALGYEHLLHYDGRTWSPVPGIPESGLQHVRGMVRTPTGIEFVGGLGTSARLESGEWSRSESGTTLSLERIWRSESGTTIAVGECGAILCRAP